MTDIIQELTAAEKTNEINSKQTLAWMKRVEIQTAQKVFIEATKDNRVQCHQKA